MRPDGAASPERSRASRPAAARTRPAAVSARGSGRFGSRARPAPHSAAARTAPPVSAVDWVRRGHRAGHRSEDEPGHGADHGEATGATRPGRDRGDAGQRDHVGDGGRIYRGAAAVGDGHGDRADAGHRHGEQGQLGAFGRREGVPGRRYGGTLGQQRVQRGQGERRGRQPGVGLQRRVPAARADLVPHHLGRHGQPRHHDRGPPAGREPTRRCGKLPVPLAGLMPHAGLVPLAGLVRLPLPLMRPALGDDRDHPGQRDARARSVQRPVHADQGDRAGRVAERVRRGEQEQACQQHRPGSHPPHR